MTSTTPAVVVFGSLHYDIIVKGPHRPRKGETVAGTAWYPKCGGKGGNQAVSAAKHGASTAMIGAVANDEFGRALLENLDNHGVDRHHVRIIDGAASGMSVAIFDSEGDYGAVFVSGTNLQVGAADIGAAEAAFGTSSVLVLQNEVPDESNVEAAAAVKRAGGTVILNAAPARAPSKELAALVDVVVVNAVEAETLASVPSVDSLETALAAARILAKDYPTAVVTAGGDGVAFVTQDGHEGAVPGIKVQLVSTHGAGDEFIGVLAAQIANSATLDTAVAKANEAAALLVSQPAQPS